MAYTQIEKEFLNNLVSVIFLSPDKELIDQGSKILEETINRRMNREKSIYNNLVKPIALEFKHISIPGTNIKDAELTIILADKVFYYLARLEDKIYSYISCL